MHTASSDADQTVAKLVSRARRAQQVAEGYDQTRVDELVAAAGWAILAPDRNRELAELAVADTGIGLGPAGDRPRPVDPTARPASGGTGLANLRERLALTFGGDATLTLADHPPRGTLATLDLPAVPAPRP